MFKTAYTLMNNSSTTTLSLVTVGLLGALVATPYFPVILMGTVIAMAAVTVPMAVNSTREMFKKQEENMSTSDIIAAGIRKAQSPMGSGIAYMMMFLIMWALKGLQITILLALALPALAITLSIRAFKQYSREKRAQSAVITTQVVVG